MTPAAIPISIATFRYRIDGHELVLSTCWPFDAATPGPLRYLVHAILIPASPNDA